MCDCITGIQNNIVRDQPFKNQNVVQAELSTMFSMVETKDGMDIQQRTYTEVALTVSGRAKPVKQKIGHAFCPFCGESYKKPEQQEAATA